MMISLVDTGAVVANSTSLVLVAVATTLVGAWIWAQRKPRDDFPPGPKGWPLLGNILEFRGETPIHVLFVDYAKKYGNVFSIRIGQQWTVVLNGADTIKEAFIKKGVEFANRPTSFTIEMFSEGHKDIAFGQYTPTWKLHRKLTHSAFRTLATGNNARFEKLVFSVLPGLTEQLNAKGSEPFEPKDLFVSTISNIIATLCFGHQYEFDGPEIKMYTKFQQEGTEISGSGLLADFIPIFKYIPTPTMRKMKEMMEQYWGLINNEIKEHRENYKEGDEPKDLIDMLFKARQEIADEGKDDISLISETHIRQTVADIFSAGIDTSSFTLHWSSSLLVQYPEVQQKVAEEVDRVVGRDRLPTINDRDNMPYTVATLYEVLRFSTFVPLAVPHATSCDVVFRGYTIPEGTWVLPNIYSMHYDEKLWDEPHKFKPEHFLDESGQMRLHPEGFLPFSTGRRVCLGESIAKAELFLLFAWLFQHYEFRKAPGLEDKDYGVGKDIFMSVIPHPYEVVVEKRF